MKEGDPMDANPALPPALPPPTPSVAEMLGASPQRYADSNIDGGDPGAQDLPPPPIAEPVPSYPAAAPPPIETGWLNPAWLSSHVAQLISLLALLGIFSQGDAANLSSWFGKAICAAFVVAANVWMIARYFRHQVELHQVAVSARKAAKNGGVIKSAGWLIALLSLFLAAPVYAQPPPRTVPTCQIGLFNFGGRRQQQQAPAAPSTDPAVLAILNQIASQQAAMNSQLVGIAGQQGQLLAAALAGKPTPQGTPAPQLIVLPQGAQPLYAPTPPGAPLYAPTPPGAPLYQPTPPGAPLYAPSVPGLPLIQIAPPGQPIIQIHSPGSAPLYAPTQPAPIAVPPPTAPQITQPPSPTPPIGTMRPVMPGASQLPPAATPQRYSYYYGRYVTDPTPLVPVTMPR
jgi:hypothetical protein